MSEKVLEINNLSLGFYIDDKFYQALYDINFSFYKGQIHALVGESGSGKTISMMAVLGLLPNNSKILSGKILYNNEDLLLMNKKNYQNIRGKKISLIPQDPMTSLNPLYTVENQMMEIGANINEIKKVLEEVEIKNIDKVLKSYPHELSGGMKQRIIIAISLLLNSEIIIADEPTTALDVTVQKQILDLIYKLKEKGKTIILITHNLGIVSKYADDTNVMYKGTIVEYNKTQELFNTPKHPYTKALIEALPAQNKKTLKNIKGQPPTIQDEILGCPYHTRCDKFFEKCTTDKPKLINNVACHLYLG